MRAVFCIAQKAAQDAEPVTRRGARSSLAHPYLEQACTICSMRCFEKRHVEQNVRKLRLASADGEGADGDDAEPEGVGRRHGTLGGVDLSW